MFPKTIDSAHQAITRSLLRASVAWFVVGLISGFLMLWMSRFPDFAQSCGFFLIGRLQLYHGGLLIFGWAFPMLLGLWTLQLPHLRQAPLRFLPLWEGAHRVWQAALIWAVVSSWFGQHSSWPTWVWMPVIYGCLALGTFLFLLAFVLNKPEHVSFFHPQMQGFILLVVGLFVLLLLLVAYLIVPGFLQQNLASFTYTLLGLGFLLPLLGLWLPISPQQGLPTSGPEATDSVISSSLFFWFLPAALVLFPLSTHVLSRNGNVAWIGLFAQAVWLVALLLLLRPLVPIWSQQTNSYPIFGKAGSLCLVLMGMQGLVFAVLRVAGHAPSPLWYSSHIHLLLLGCAWLWLHGAMLHLFSAESRLSTHFAPQVRWLLLGLGMVLIGSWLETSLHLHLDQLSLSRGTLFPAGIRTLRWLGGILLLLPLIRWIALTWHLTKSSTSLHRSM